MQYIPCDALLFAKQCPAFPRVPIILTAHVKLLSARQVTMGLLSSQQVQEYSPLISICTANISRAPE